jgi:hypothetical protein
MNLQSSTLKADESGEPFHIQQARQIRGSDRRGPMPDINGSRVFRCRDRSFALMNDLDRAYFGRDASSDQVGVIDNMRAVFGRSTPLNLTSN